MTIKPPTHQRQKSLSIYALMPVGKEQKE